MAASQHIGSQLAGEIINANTTSYIPIGPNVEAQGNSTTIDTYIRAAGEIDLSCFKVSANTLSSSCTITLVKNGTDTAHTISIASGTGYFFGTGGAISFSAGDRAYWKVVTAAGTGSITLIMQGFKFTPTNSAHCVTFMSAFANSSSSMSTAGSTFFTVPNGTRSVPGTTEAESQFKSYIQGFLRGLTATAGNQTTTEITGVGIRRNGSDETALEVSFAAGVDNVLQDDPTGEVSIFENNLFNYYIRIHASETGTFNLERISTEFVSEKSDFVFIISSPNGTTYGSNVYIPISGEQAANFSATETDAEFTVKQSFRLSRLRVNVLANTANTNGGTIRVRKNGANTNLALRINQGTGFFENRYDFVDVAVDDEICFAFQDAAASGNIRIQSISVIGNVNSGGGGGIVDSTPIYYDASTQSAEYTTTSPQTFTHFPSALRPKGVVVFIAQDGSTDRTTAVTYGGVSMTRVPTDGFAVDTAGEPLAMYCYTLFSGIPEGNQTVSITHDGNSVAKRAFCLTIQANNTVSIHSSGRVQENTANPGVALDTGSIPGFRLYGVHTGIGVAGNITPNGEYTQAFEATGPGSSRVHNIGYQTTTASGSSTAGVTMGNDDVALIALALVEEQKSTPVRGRRQGILYR